MGEFVFGQQRDVFHGFGVFEQGFAGGRQLVALRVLYKQCGTEAFLDRLDVTGHGGMGGFQTLRGGEQAATALQLKKKP